MGVAATGDPHPRHHQRDPGVAAPAAGAAGAARGAARRGEEVREVLAYHYEQAWRYKFETGERVEDLAHTAIEARRRAGARASRLRTLPQARRALARAP